jgi:transcriptional regulator of heat shock response
VGAATIRAELNTLTRKGYLAQTHVSSGRVPTDKGYRFFVRRLCDDLISNRVLSVDRKANVFEELLEKEKDYREFVRHVADSLHLFAGWYSFKDGALYQRGLDKLFDELELEDRREFSWILKDMEYLNERCMHFEKKALRSLFRKKIPQVFIGNNPLTTSRQLAVIMDIYPEDDKEQFLFFVVGPKRMNYRKNLLFFLSLRQHISYDR